MIMAPIDGREFSAASRGRRKSPAVCQISQLLRLVAIAAIASAFVTFALAPDRAKAVVFVSSLGAQAT